MSLKVSSDLRNFALHDGTVEFIRYYGDGNDLIVAVALTEEANIQTGWFGKLIFHQVNVLESKPPLETIDWDLIARTNIASADEKPEHNSANLEAVFWAIALYLPDGREEWLILEFLAESFEWIPDRSRLSPYL